MNGKYPPPRLISWNVTLRCPLKCDHCYVDAGKSEAGDVLSTKEAEKVIDSISESGSPLLILSGGEPLMRDDICGLVAYGTKKGLRMAMGTSGFTLDENMARRLKDAGLKAVAISLDSVDPAFHDKFRGTAGAWEKAVSAIEYCKDADIDVQINMTMVSPDMKNVESVIGMGSSMGVSDYQIFFPVHTGRGENLEIQDPDNYETIIREILEKYNESDLNIRPTCAPQFRRIAKESGIDNKRWGRGCIAGISYCRIYANGEVTPCPYLPLSAGNLREKSFGDIWQNSGLFAALRDPGLLTGKCGRCGYTDICGGCRARAYAGSKTVPVRWCDGLMEPYYGTGEVCGEDPWCPYEP
ncbi:radical SAM/SPASM domain-containing protein [Methanolacinia paynteri]|uniref:radical SAM/SPASM domain-containing protein n=1 Tax=Methanolacinia paynteri TaxID=230356 RepID=UPI0006944B41|nr:radical SAM protein [Methanolacinia paynteri]